ncbi:MAG: hypothetical protein ACJ73D_04320 [Pyrinomonadaceae bacterium]
MEASPPEDKPAASNRGLFMVIAIVLIGTFFWRAFGVADEIPSPGYRSLTIGLDLLCLLSLIGLRVQASKQVPAITFGVSVLFWFGLLAGLGLFAIRLSSTRSWETGHLSYKWDLSSGSGALSEKVPAYRKTTTTASGVKITVDEKPGQAVSLSQGTIWIKQPLLVNGNKVEGDISLVNSASYPPGAPTCKDPFAVMKIDHIKPSLDGWQYSKDTKISYIVDGVEMKPTSDGLPPAPPTPSTDHTIYLERITVSPTCDTWQKIANSGSTQIRIGDALVDLSDHDRSVIKEFASAIGLQ